MSLKSAIANAENNHDLDVDDLIVSEAHVGNGIVMKRFAPRKPWPFRAVFLKPFSQPDDRCSSRSKAEASA